MKEKTELRNQVEMNSTQLEEIERVSSITARRGYVFITGNHGNNFVKVYLKDIICIEADGCNSIIPGIIPSLDAIFLKINSAYFGKNL